MRAAIYARFSSDLQDVRSINDQVSMARKYAESRSQRVIGVFEDAAISGASVINRPGLQRLLADAAVQKFDVVVTESLDRLSRSQADIAALFERLSFLGVRIETLADGLVSEIHVGLKGTMSALFLKDLAQKTRRGQIGRVKAGRIPGGRSYGYDVVRDGEDRGQRVINASEAAVIQRIYEEYVSGKGTIAIVKDLNREKVPGPTGGAWNASSLIGSPKRRNGLLNNELYRGVIVYNRQRFVKDPSTGKRVSRPNPESEWLRQDVPALRIIEEPLWARAQRMREARGGPQIHTKRGPQRLLSGLIYCGCCGAKYNIATKDHLRCSAKTNSGTCDSSRLVRVGEVEERVLVALERRVFTPDNFAVAMEAYRLEHARSQTIRDDGRERLESELADIKKKFERLLRMSEDGHIDPTVAGPRLNELAAKQRELTAELALRPDDAPIAISEDAADTYRKMLAKLRLKTHDDAKEARVAAQVVRSIVHRVTIQPRADDDRQPIEIEAGFVPVGQLASTDCNFGCGGRI